MCYIALDGGGTKLEAVCFDENLKLLSRAKAHGTHLSVYPVRTIKENIAKCYEDLFSDLPKPLHIETMYVICGNSNMYLELLPEGITVGRTVVLGEGTAGLYAGLVKDTGFVALSGTGSDVFAVKSGECLELIGGWGAILGDEGSGVWISRQAMQAAIRCEQGWGEHTQYGKTVCEYLKLNALWDFVPYLYSSDSPFRALGELLPLAARTAKNGDTVIRDIFIRGGDLLARQMVSLLGRCPEIPREITACGGAWKSGRFMREGFEAQLKKHYPDADFSMPLFEHIAAGPIALMLEKGVNREKIIQTVAEKFPMYAMNRERI